MKIDKRHSMGLISAVLLVVAILFATNGNANPYTALYPQAVKGDIRAVYARTFIELALEKTRAEFGDWSFQFTDIEMERSRMEFELEDGQRVNLLLLPGSTDADAQFLRIDHKLDRGLAGTRILLIRRDRQHLFNRVENLDDLRRFSFISGSSWDITRHMQRAGLQIAPWASYRSMFSILAAGRVDGFGRGATEILPELKQYKPLHPDLVIETGLILRTDLAFYLYASPRHSALARRIDAGLTAAKKDSSFDHTFTETFGKGLSSLNLDRRRAIDLVPTVN